MLTPKAAQTLRDRIWNICQFNRAMGATPGRYTPLEEAAFEEGRLAALNIVLQNETSGESAGAARA